MLVLVPPFESAREQLFNSLFDCQSGILNFNNIYIFVFNCTHVNILVITLQNRIKNSRYQVKNFSKSMIMKNDTCRLMLKWKTTKMIDCITIYSLNLPMKVVHRSVQLTMLSNIYSLRLKNTFR